MKALLDTNIIIIHREASKVINSDNGYLFKWLDKLKIEKCIHPLAVMEINKFFYALEKVEVWGRDSEF